MRTYIWEAEKDIEDVISCLKALTDTPDIIDCNLCNHKKLSCKQLGSGEYLFSIWFHYGLWNKISYALAPINGIIKATIKGCRIEA